MTAALEASRAGYKTILVEKSDALGGLMAKWHKRFPREGAFAVTQENDTAALVAEVELTDAIPSPSRSPARSPRLAARPGPSRSSSRAPIQIPIPSVRLSSPSEATPTTLPSSVTSATAPAKTS